MSGNTNTSNTTAFVFEAAREAYSTLHRAKGLRAQSVWALLDAADNDTRDDVIEEWGSDYIRRGLREAAIAFEGNGDTETANAFWVLRDSIDMGREGFLDFGNDEDEDGTAIESVLEGRPGRTASLEEHHSVVSVKVA